VSRLFTRAALAVIVLMAIVTGWLLLPHELVVLALLVAGVGAVLLYAWRRADRANSIRRDSTRGF